MIIMPGAFQWLGVCMEPCTPAAACGLRVAVQECTYLNLSASCAAFLTSNRGYIPPHLARRKLRV